MEPNLIGTYTNFDTYASDLFEKLLKTTKITNNLPDSDSFRYYIKYKPFLNTTTNTSQRILDLAQRFLELEKGQKAPVINVIDDNEQILDQFEYITDVVDGLIEKVVSNTARVKVINTVKGWIRR